MPHQAPAALEVLTADYLDTLDENGAYSPVLTAATTNPNLGADGEALGFWQRNGHLFTVEVRFLFSGSGLSAGSGNYSISLPFAADLSIYRDSNAALGGSLLGTAGARDASTPGNSRTGAVQLNSATTVMVVRNDTTPAPFSNDTPFTWATSDRFNLNFAYMADPAGMP